MNTLLPFVVLVVLLASPVAAADQPYDPLKTTGKVTVLDHQFEYGRDKRIVPLKIYLPATDTPATVVLFSHGLGGSRDNNKYLGSHWAGRGYVVVVMQHAGSDTSVWKGVPFAQRMDALKKAASGAALQGRIGDVTATLDQLQEWNTTDKKLARRFDLNKVGMSGHSFGAVTTQAVSGQSYGRRGQVNTDKRIKAAIAFSPSVPMFGDNETTFGSVNIPWLLMTGTKDSSIIARTTPASRRKVFQMLPEKDQSYELVLHEAEHMAFSDRTLVGRQQRNPNHHKAIMAISTAFWDTYLQDDKAAEKWLRGNVQDVLEEADVWQVK